MILRKWNYERKEYDLVEVGLGNFKTYSTDMDEIVDCPHCKKKLRFGDGYTSLEFQTSMGFGYVVCKDCYNIEWKFKEKLAKVKEND